MDFISISLVPFDKQKKQGINEQKKELGKEQRPQIIMNIQNDNFNF